MKKMFTNNRLGAIAAIACLSAVSSCRNEAILDFSKDGFEEVTLLSESKLPEAVQLNRDWLHFPDIRSFEKTISELEKMESEEALVKWEKQYRGFSSWRSGESETVYDKSPDQEQIDIPDPILTTVLNDAGRIQIADTIYQVGRREKSPALYAVPARFEKELTGGADLSGIKDVKTHALGLVLLPFPKWEDNDRVITPIPISDICDFPTSLLFPWWGQKGGLIYNANNGAELTKDNGRQIRIDYHRWRVGFIFYSSIGVRVKLYKHTRFGGWMSNINMNSASIQACSKGIVMIPGLLPVPYHEQRSATASNTNSLERTLKWAVAPLHVEVLPHHFNFSFNVNYRGQQVSRSVKE